MVDVNKREELLKAYPKSDSWRDKVAKMSDEQVTAVYLRLRSQGKLGS